jgi:LacI family transcriptional regulator
MSPNRRLTDAHPTLATVAHRAGVSRQTVSNALNSPDLLKPETLARVLAVIDELGYSPNRAARQLRTRSSKLIGLRVEPANDATSPAPRDRFLHALVDRAARTGHQLLLFSGDPGDPLDGYDALLRATAVDGFVVLDQHTGASQSDLLRRIGAPFVTFGRPWDDPASSRPWVDVDDAAGVRNATEHLLAGGHPCVAWFDRAAGGPVDADRRSGWQAAVRAAGVPTDGLTRSLHHDVATSRAEAGLLLDEGVRAFACSTDTLALGVLQAALDRGLRPGVDVGVTGFDDSPAAQLCWPGLTSVRRPLEEVAAEIVDLLGAVLSLRPVENPARLLEPDLVVRASTHGG